MIDNKKKEALKMLRDSEKIYVLVSACTRMPYVECSPETFDDEVYLFYKEEDAKKEAKRLAEAKNPVRVVAVKHEQLLAFYTGFYTIGVNCLAVNKGTAEEITVQLPDLVRRVTRQDAPEGTVIVENPELQLTAMYFLQETRKQPEIQQITQEMRDLYEEMLAHFQKGIYLIAVNEGRQTAILENKKGEKYQPVFTDIQEFVKFEAANHDAKYRPNMMKAEDIPHFLTEGSAGVLINPSGIALQMQIRRNKQ